VHDTYPEEDDVQDELLMPEEAAKLLRVSEGTLRDWRYRGVGPAYIRVGQRPRYDVRDLERWLRDRRQETQEQEPAASAR
jgi:predicted site-specific integrase-resolvase